MDALGFKACVGKVTNYWKNNDPTSQPNRPVFRQTILEIALGVVVERDGVDFDGGFVFEPF